MMVAWWWIPVSWLIIWCTVISVATLWVLVLGFKRTRAERKMRPKYKQVVVTSPTRTFRSPDETA